MQRPLSIAFHGLRSSPALAERIREHVDHLSTRCPRLLGARVVMEQRNHRHRTGDLFGCTVQLKVGGAAPLVARDEDQDPLVTLTRVFATAERKLLAARTRRRQKMRHPSETLPLGRVERVFTYEGYGFLTDGSGREVYFDENAVVDGEFASLTPGAQVRFTESMGDDGPQASSVHARGRAAGAPRAMHVASVEAASEAASLASASL